MSWFIAWFASMDLMKTIGLAEARQCSPIQKRS